MKEQFWFSTKVRLVCLIEPLGAHRYMDSVFVFRSSDFDAAFKRALELGRSQESSFLNNLNQHVVWKLKEIVSLDQLDAQSLDGVEVYSEPVALGADEQIPFDAEFHPEESTPTQTV
jgi:hypothetical protein